MFCNRSSLSLLVPTRGRLLTLGLLALLQISTSGAQSVTTPTDEQLEFFESRIRPVLVEQCYACHNSADAAEGGLVVDHRQGLLDGGDGGPIVVPRQPERSRLIAILRHEVEGLEMPEDGPKLGDAVIDDFEKWIAMGAPDPRNSPPTGGEIAGATSWESTVQRRKQWWSFQPIKDPQVPSPENSTSDNPIDRFIARRLQELGLEPSPRESDATLIRRLYLTLIGLPPSPGEMAEWSRRYAQADVAWKVTDELIDYLLASDHFGERWARHWMDWIRYAESHGSEGDPRIDNAWLYRDYLIRALNSDVPYDQLVREHVAGDLLDPPRVNDELGINESIIGTAHWRMVFHGFAPTDALDEKVRFIDDQINAFSKAVLGLTVSCARCHDHKFDAISQRDYYAMFGILASCRPGRLAVDLPGRQQRNREALLELKPKIRGAIADDWLASLSELTNRLPGDGSNDEGQSGNQARAAIHSVVHPWSLLRELDEETFHEAWQQLTRAVVEQPAVGSQAESGIVESWNFADADGAASWNLVGTGLENQPTGPGVFAIAPSGNQLLVGIYPSGIYSHLRSNKLAARLTSPDIDLSTETELWLRVLGDGQATARYVVQDYPRRGTVYPVTQLKPQWKWERFDLSYWTGDSVHLEVTTSKDAPLLVNQPERSWFGISEVRLVKKGSAAPHERPAYLSALVEAARSEGDPESAQQLADLYRTAIRRAIDAWRADNLSDAQAELLSGCLSEGLLGNTPDQLPGAFPLVERYRRLEAEIPTPTRVPALEETSGRRQALFIRGNHRNPAEVVPRRFLEVMATSDYGYEDSGRLELAEDLVRLDNPFTRRVIVNRVWHHLFGRGIVGTPDNLGRMGDEPTHPELLDWLACRLVDDGWSLKSLIRRIVSSSAWQQSSRPSDAAASTDPNNLYLSHANLRRLEAEAIRDSLLSASGNLDRTLFGPPVGGESNRRSLYVSVIRNNLDPLLRSFDFPEPSSATGRRDVTNVPAQSLTLLNDPLVHRWAASLAASVVQMDANAEPANPDAASGASADDARLTRLFLTLLSRPPKQDELARARTHLKATRESFERHDRQHARLKQQLDGEEQTIAGILEAALETTQSDERISSSTRAPRGPGAPAPIASWDFEDGTTDSVAGLDGIPHGNVKIQEGKLVLGSGAYLTTPPLETELTEKTLEAWVQLDNLEQRGGGVLSVQSPDGRVFDAIVFGEIQPRHWLAGSDFHQRTERLGGDSEDQAIDQPVHLAICYHGDGQIVAYRNGARYGKAYRTSPPVRFDNAIVSFGLRHLPAGGNRLLSGKIDYAAIYDRALTADEVAASFQRGGGRPARKQLVAVMTPRQRQRLADAEAARDQLRNQLHSLGPAGEPRELAVWTEMSRALMLLKEFIYVR